MIEVGDTFGVVVTSDPQYPWYDQILPPGLKSENEVKLNSQRQIVQQYESINDLAEERASGNQPIEGVVINGDLTAFGHSWQYEQYDQFLRLLTVPYYPSLGNHDYSNNVDDCYNNDCATRMVNFMYSWLKNAGDVDSYDFSDRSYYQFPELRTDFTGSLAYSFNLGRVHMVQLQNFPSYEDEWNSWNAGGARRDFFFIKSSMHWLLRDLALARNRGDVIVVYLHDYDDNFIEPYVSEFKRMMLDYRVSAVFAGHIHPSCGEIARITGAGRDIPVFRSGSASYQDYLVADFDLPALTAKVSKYAAPYEEAYAPTGDTWQFPLDSFKPDPPLPVPPSEGYVTVQNSGGFTAWFQIRYTHDGEQTTISTGDMLLGNNKRYEMPIDATKIHVKGMEQTGLAWEGWRTVFDLNFDSPPNKCFRLTGTTLNPKWDNECT